VLSKGTPVRVIIRTYIKGLPESLVESAKLDGAGDLGIYVRIIMPLCKPVLATIALFVAVGVWNEWFDAFIYSPVRPDLEVLQGVLRQFLAAAMNVAGAGQQVYHHQQTVMATPLTLRAAITIFTALPILLVFPFLQRYIVHGMTLGGVKE